MTKMTMDANELRALADALDPSGKVLTHPGESALQRAAAHLRAQADAKPVGYFGKSAMDSDVWIEMESWATNAIPLYTHPAPAVPAGYKLVPVEPTAEWLEVGRKAIEDALVEWRDERLSEPNRANGCVIRERDGTPSNIIRFGLETALRIGYKAMLAAAPAAPQEK